MNQRVVGAKAGHSVIGAALVIYTAAAPVQAQSSVAIAQGFVRSVYDDLMDPSLTISVVPVRRDQAVSGQLRAVRRKGDRLWSRVR